jgi:hypothetical protein
MHVRTGLRRALARSPDRLLAAATLYRSAARVCCDAHGAKFSAIPSIAQHILWLLICSAAAH